MEQQQDENKQKDVKNDFILDRYMDAFGVEFLTKDFFFKNWKTIAACVITIFFYINNKYAHNQQLKEINQLKNQLQDIKYESLTRSSELMGIWRASQLKELVKKNGVDLEESNCPPYNLND